MIWMLSGKGSTKSIKTIKPSESRNLAKIVSEIISKKVTRDKKDLIAAFEYLIIVMSCLDVLFLVLAYIVEANTTLNEFSYIPITHETFSTKSNSSSSIYFPQLRSVYI